MTTPTEVCLTAIEAVKRIEEELVHADEALQKSDLNCSLDAQSRALGLALQLGPAATERVLLAVLHSAQAMASRRDAEGLSALGPAVVDLITQVQDAGALPATVVMDAWAKVTLELGALIGLVGLALAIEPVGCRAMMDSARQRAVVLDEATTGLLALTAWLDQLVAGN